MVGAKLWYAKGREIRCFLCWNRCLIRENSFGHCKARYNERRVLKTLTYGNLSAIESRPVEIKPFFHFMPGTTSITFSTYSCNLDCPWCQNWHLSKKPPPRSFKAVSPEELIEVALKRGDKSTCASFNEPTLLFEFLIDLFPLANKHGLKNTMVSNGFMMPKALKMLIDAGLDAVNFDIKGDDVYSKISKAGKDSFVWRNARLALKEGVHVEMVCLLSPPLYRNFEIVEEIIASHLKYLDPEVPIHYTRYFPAYLTLEAPTPAELLERAVKRSREEGISYAYVGNVRHRFENTFCPECDALLIRRGGWRMLENRLEGNRCFRCGREISIVL